MEFYVYVYLDTRKVGKFNYGKFNFEYEPFYVGKGKNKRCEEHLWKSRLNSSCYKSRKINKIIQQGYTPIILKLAENLNENEAFQLEKELILIIGRNDIGIGPLTNLTNGGEGISGLIKTEIHRKNLSISAIGRKNSEEAKQKISESLKGKIGRNTGNKHTEETKNKISKSKLGKISWNAIPILQYDLNNILIRKWQSAKHAAESLNLSQGNIWSVINGKRKTCGKFIWKINNN